MTYNPYQQSSSSSSSIQQQEQRLLDPNDTFATLCTKLNLDPRIRKAIARMGFIRPTLVQSQSLPLAIQSGRDLLVRARTGSGKTLAYVIPVLQKVLKFKESNANHLHDQSLSQSQSQSQLDMEKHFIKAVILVPTRELCRQVYLAFQSLCYYCEDVIGVALLSNNNQNNNHINLPKTEKEQLAAQEAMLRDRPDIIVSTPAGLLKHIENKSILLKQSVDTFVVDEADLVLSFGYSNDISKIVTALPKICQGFLLSATLSPELDALKKIVLHSPAILKLEEEHDLVGVGGKYARDGSLMQFYLKLPKRDKNLVIYVFLKLGLLKGKGLFFVNSTDAGYRLKLFLEQFHIRSAVLNSELPARSRMSIIDQFNAGNFDYLIATDESANVNNQNNNLRRHKTISNENQTMDELEQQLQTIDDDDDHNNNSNSNNDNNHPDQDDSHKKSKHKKKRKKDLEYGVSRGLDFRNVSFVFNVDMPTSPESYTHRIGRTARGGAKGVALTLVSDPSMEGVGTTSKKLLSATKDNSTNKKNNPTLMNELEMLHLIQASQPPLTLFHSSSHQMGAAATGAAATGGGGGGGSSSATSNMTEELQQQQEQRDQEVQLQPCPLDFELKELEGFRYRVEDVSRAVTRTAVRETRAAELKAELLNSERLSAHFEENPSDLRILRHDRTATHVSMVQEHLKNVPSYMLPRGMQVAQMKKKRKRRNYNSNHNRRNASMNKTNDPLHSYDNTASLPAPNDFIGVAGNDGFFGDDTQNDVHNNSESTFTDNNNKRPKKDGEKKMYMTTHDGTGKSTSGRKDWKAKHHKGKFSKKYKKTETAW